VVIKCKEGINCFINVSWPDLYKYIEVIIDKYVYYHSSGSNLSDREFIYNDVWHGYSGKKK
jgi:hypothetical protein